MHFKEMTFSAGKQDFSKDPDFSKSHKIGELNGFNVLQNNSGYALDKNNKIYTWIFAKPSSHGEVINAIRTIPEARRQHLAENLLFWLKSYLKKNLIFGDTMSNDAISLVRGLANSGRFKIFWLNIKTGERQIYNQADDHRDVEPFRSSLEPTERLVLIEAFQGNFFRNKYDEWNKMEIITDLFANYKRLNYIKT